MAFQAEEHSSGVSGSFGVPPDGDGVVLHMESLTIVGAQNGRFCVPIQNSVHR